MNTGKKLAANAHQTRTGSAGRMIQIAARRLTASMSAQLASKGLKLDQFALMMSLTEGEDLTQTELGQRMEMPNYAITRALDVLSEMGLVERRPDASSRRSHRVFLTEKGRALMPELFEVVKEVNTELMQPLDLEERKVFVNALRKIIR